MGDQLGLKFGDDICRNYHRGNAESVRAYESVKLSAGHMRGRIVGMIREREMTCDEIEEITGWKHQTVSARISELKRDGWIIPVDRRKTRSGCSAAVYAIRKGD